MLFRSRATGQASKFGAFLDSTLDRTGESLVIAGVVYGCATGGFAAGAGLAALAITFASVVTYARAKAESLGVHGEVGVAPRPERLVILAAGLVLAGILGGVGPGPERGGGAVALAIALGIIAVLSAITVVQRILHVRQQLDSTE